MSRIVLVTGASSGYGKATAKAFADNGDTVIIAARNTEKLLAAKQEVNADSVFAMDVNNAGGGVAIKDTQDLSVKEIDSTVMLNLNSVIYGCREFAADMKKHKTGTVINISSVCAKECWPQWSVYAAAKAGVLNFSKGFYLEMQPYNVRVSCIIPSSASTGFQKSCGIGETTDKLLPEDIAQTVLYVANLPQRAVVEEVTVWGIDKQVNPL